MAGAGMLSPIPPSQFGPTPSFGDGQPKIDVPTHETQKEKGS